MKNLKCLIIITALCRLAVTGADAAGVGTTGAQFLKIGVGARPMAMGSAFVALPDDANAINWNPGALSQVKKRDITASYNSLFVDEKQGFLAYAAPFGESSTVGVGLNYLVVSKIEKRAGDTETEDSLFDNKNYALILSYGKQLDDALSLGANIKYIREELDTFKESAVAMDFGALYKTGVPNLTAGLAMQNLGSKIGPDPLPMTLKGGAAYKLFNNRLVMASDVDWLAVDDRAYIDVGAEYWAHKMLALRAGYQFGRNRDDLGSSLVGFGTGIGLAYDNFRFDYAFVPFGDLGDTHRMTLGMTF